MLTIKGLDHVVFRTSDMAAMQHFYCDILGCPIERELPAEVGLVQLRAGNALIDLVALDSELGRAGGDAPQQNGRNVEHVCLQIAPLEETKLQNYLLSHGVECSEFSERYGAQGFGRSTYIQDPQGNIIELKPFVQSD